MSEYVCEDCGSNLVEAGFISCVCPACGGMNPMTKRDYREYADAVDADVDGPDGDAKLVVSRGIEGVALTDGEVWVHCKNPEDTQDNL